MKFLALTLVALLFNLAAAATIPSNIAERQTTDNGYDDGFFGTKDPVWDEGYPLPGCPDVDYCPVKFHWRTSSWDAPHGICKLCKDLEAHDWHPLPYNVWPQVMKEGICKKWQPPSKYTC